MAEIRWHGHNCFRVRGREATVLTDPVGRNTGYAMGKQNADIVTISHSHPGHTNLNALRPEFRVVDGPGEYEISNVFLTGVRTYHDDRKGADLGYNTAFLFELEDMTFCHLGDLGHPLTTDQAEILSQCDILMIPIGGPPTLTPELAVDIVSMLEPKVILPMQFATALGDSDRMTIEDFAKALGSKPPEPLDKLTLKKSDLTETPTLIVLQPDAEVAKR